MNRIILKRKVALLDEMQNIKRKLFISRVESLFYSTLVYLVLHVNERHPKLQRICEKDRRCHINNNLKYFILHVIFIF
jgi:hypothetical protein